MSKSRILAGEGLILIALGVANAISGRLLGAAIIALLGFLSLACGWMLSPAD